MTEANPNPSDQRLIGVDTQVSPQEQRWQLMEGVSRALTYSPAFAG